MRIVEADLHIHTALSPCGADEMTPPAIVLAALERGLSMIAICDHNAAGNVAAAQRAARGAPAVIAGMEITTAEEVHVLGFFPSAEAATAAAAEVAATLPATTERDRQRFGEQWLMDEKGHTVGAEPKMLAAASRFDLCGAVGLVHRFGGLAVAAHVNRRTYSVISQLGVFPQDAGFDALEVHCPPGSAAAPQDYARLGLAVLCSSDSHYLADVGRVRSRLELAAPTFEELALCLRGEGGRSVLGA